MSIGAARDIAQAQTISNPPAPTADGNCGHREQLAAAQRNARWDQRNLTLYRQLVAGREDERARHRDQVAKLEARIEELRSTVADMLTAFTDHDRPACGSARARSRWVTARTLRQWRDRIIQPDPDETGAAA